jgi:hypothetical protein
MSDRPNYMPPWFNWRSVPPVIMILWFAVMFAFTLGFLIWWGTDGTEWAFLLALAGNLLVDIYAIVYVPRAWRAYKAGESGGWQRGRWWRPG